MPYTQRAVAYTIQALGTADNYLHYMASAYNDLYGSGYDRLQINLNTDMKEKSF